MACRQQRASTVRSLLTPAYPSSSFLGQLEPHLKNRLDDEADQLCSVIVVGILVSYIPQHYKIIHRRSSEGLAPLFILLGTVSGTSSIAAQLVLPSTRRDIGCCKVNNGFSCAAGLLGILQVGIQWSCFFIM